MLLRVPGASQTSLTVGRRGRRCTLAVPVVGALFAVYGIRMFFVGAVEVDPDTKEKDPSDCSVPVPQAKVGVVLATVRSELSTLLMSFFRRLPETRTPDCALKKKMSSFKIGF